MPVPPRSYRHCYGLNILESFVFRYIYIIYIFIKVFLMFSLLVNLRAHSIETKLYQKVVLYSLCSRSHPPLLSHLFIQNCSALSAFLLVASYFFCVFILIHSLSKYQRVIQRQSVLLTESVHRAFFPLMRKYTHNANKQRKGERERKKKSFGLFAKQSDARIKVTVHVWKVLCCGNFRHCHMAETALSHRFVYM